MISKQSLVLLMVVLSAFSTPIMLSATNVALSTISRHFLLDAVVVSWIPMAYLMASAMFVLIFGRCADLFGRKKIFMIGIIFMNSIILMNGIICGRWGRGRKGREDATVGKASGRGQLTKADRGGSNMQGVGTQRR